jgi:hypothetical protein
MENEQGMKSLQIWNHCCTIFYVDWIAAVDYENKNKHNDAENNGKQQLPAK